tara:strand:- start:94 stop:543 length:450 start_codon:yes stop_codon:yes gene_type:complete
LQKTYKENVQITSKDIECLRKGTRPEKIVRRTLTNGGYSYYLNVKKLPGKPDIVIRGKKKIIMINGCFWHRHACPSSVIPKTNNSHWTKRLQYNQMRDFFVLTQLVTLGYDLMILWECEIENNSETHLSELLTDFINSEQKYEFINSNK